MVGPFFPPNWFNRSIFLEQSSFNNNSMYSTIFCTEACGKLPRDWCWKLNRDTWPLHSHNMTSQCLGRVVCNYTCSYQSTWRRDQIRNHHNMLAQTLHSWWCPFAKCHPWDQTTLPYCWCPEFPSIFLPISSRVSTSWRHLTLSCPTLSTRTPYLHL